MVETDLGARSASWEDFSLGHDSVLVYLEKDSEYRRLETEALRFGQIQGESVERILRRQSWPILKKAGGALCLRGSHARRDGTMNSDIDIIYIADHVSYELSRSFLDHLQPHFQQRVSVQCYHTVLNRFERERLGVWQSLRHMRFLAGGFQIFLAAGANIRKRLQGQRMKDLLSLYQLDQLNQSLLSSAFTSPTRGLGGIVDYEFLQLLAAWQRLKNKELTSVQARLLSEALFCYRYLATYKYMMSQCSVSGRWFASAEAHLRLRTLLHGRLCLYVSGLQHS